LELTTKYKEDIMSQEELTENVEQVEATEEATSEVEEIQQDPVESETTDLEPSTEEQNEDTAPKDNKAWAAMRAELKRLKEAEAHSNVDADYLRELETLTGREQYQPPRIDPQQYEEMDETQRQILEAREEARRARLEVNNFRRESEDRLAEERFPELKTDPLFKQLVAEKRLVSEVMQKGKTTLQIATEVSNLLGKQRQQSELVAEESVRQQQAQKAVATSEGATAPSGGRSTFNDEETRQRIARGDQQFTTEHLKNKYLEGLDF
jgi:hypothetical protein